MSDFNKKIKEWALMVENNTLDGNDNEHVVSEMGPHLTYTEVELSPEEYSNGMKWYPFYLLHDIFSLVDELAGGIKDNEPWATKDDNDGVEYFPSDGSIILHDSHSDSWGRFYSSSIRLVNEHPDNANSAVVGFVDMIEKLFDHDLLYVKFNSFMEGKIPRNIVSNIHDKDIELKKYHPNQKWPVDYYRFTISPGNYEIKIPGFLDITVTIRRDFTIVKEIPQTRNLTPTKQNTNETGMSIDTNKISENTGNSWDGNHPSVHFEEDLPDNDSQFIEHIKLGKEKDPSIRYVLFLWGNQKNFVISVGQQIDKEFLIRGAKWLKSNGLNRNMRGLISIIDLDVMKMCLDDKVDDLSFSITGEYFWDLVDMNGQPSRRSQRMSQNSTNDPDEYDYGHTPVDLKKLAHDTQIASKIKKFTDWKWPSKR